MPGRTPSLRQQLRILRFTGDHGSMLHRDLRVKEKQAAASAKIAIEKSFIPPSLPSSPLSTAAVPDTPLSPLPESRPLRSGSFICHAGPVTGLPKNGCADRFPVPLRAHVCGPHRYRRNMAAPSTIRPPAAGREAIA